MARPRPPPPKTLFLRFVPVWGATLLLLSIVAAATRTVVGDSRPAIKAAFCPPLGLLLLLGGLLHFAPPLRATYMAMMPPALPAPAAMLALSGVAEAVVGAALLVAPRGQPHEVAAWAAVATLVAIFPANVFMAVNAGSRTKIGVSRGAALARLPLQGTLLVWAHWYTR